LRGAAEERNILIVFLNITPTRSAVLYNLFLDRFIAGFTVGAIK
jgi:hypothetical protein